MQVHLLLVLDREVPHTLLVCYLHEEAAHERLPNIPMELVLVVFCDEWNAVPLHRAFQLREDVVSLRERAAEVNELLLQKAYFYVCGDAANMAREVNEILGQIIAEHRGVDKKKGEEIVKSMRSANQYQEDVWS